MDWSPLNTTLCGRGLVQKAASGSGWNAFVDGSPLKRPKGRAPVRFSTKQGAQKAVLEFLDTGDFTPPTFDPIYKTYDPSTEGFGHPGQWRAIFSQLFAPLRGNEPYEVLEVSASSTWTEIKAAYRRQAMAHHPDHDGNVETFCRIREAFEVLKARMESVKSEATS